MREHILCSSVCVSDAPGLFIRVINAPKFAAKKKLTILLSLIFFFYPGFLFGSYTPQKLQRLPTLAKCDSVKFTDLDLFEENTF